MKLLKIIFGVALISSCSLKKNLNEKKCARLLNENHIYIYNRLSIFGYEGTKEDDKGGKHGVDISISADFDKEDSQLDIINFMKAVSLLINDRTIVFFNANGDIIIIELKKNKQNNKMVFDRVVVKKNKIKLIEKLVKNKSKQPTPTYRIKILDSLIPVK
jgi:hypothetical protein